MKTPQILVVEDEAIIAHDLKNNLERHGYLVLPIACTASDAVELAVQERLDIILMDVLLKGIQNGIDAACAIIERYTVPILFMTGNTHLLNDERLKKIPIFKALEKPPFESVLLDTIKNLIKK